MTRTLVFDIGNVLIPFDPQLALQELAGNSSYSQREITRLLKQWRQILDYECGRLRTEQFFSEICSHLKLNSLSLEQFMDIWSGIFFDKMLVSPEILRSLKRSYRLILLSNTNQMHFSFMQRKFPILGEFHDAVLSFQVGFMKPDPRIFQEAIARSYCAPDEMFYVDDIEENVKVACSLGIPAIRFESEAQLLREFEARQIEV